VICWSNIASGPTLGLSYDRVVERKLCVGKRLIRGFPGYIARGLQCEVCGAVDLRSGV
jgi:hypothetical protein